MISEQQIHSMMDNLALDCLPDEDKAWIIAEAHSNLQSNNIRTASKNNLIVNAILDAIGCNIKTSDKKETKQPINENFFEKYTSKVLNINLDEIGVDGHECKDTLINDMQPTHPPSQYIKPGTGKSRNDIVH